MKQLTKHKIYTRNGSKFHVVCERADTTSTSDKFMRFVSGGITAANPLVSHLIVAKEDVVAVESTPQSEKPKEFDMSGYIHTFEQIKALQTPRFEKFKDNHALSDAIRSYSTTHLNFGRGTGKTRAAVALARIAGNALLVRDTQTQCHLRTCDDKARIISPVSIYNEHPVHGDRDTLIVDEYGSFPTINYLVKSEIFKYAADCGFKHVLFLGE